MNKKTELDEKWIKASIIGTIWAASEIVLGSFLHNLKVPFSGNVLTAIGLVILISVSYIWTEKGLFWRAGLICAIMKTMSPSAVIFGPMIAIFSEAVLLEISVRLFGKTLVGYTLGSMLAMSWNLFQKIINLIIFYGFNIVDLYTNLIKIAQKQLNLKLDIVWLPLIFLLVVYCILGIISAIVGIKVGRKLLVQQHEIRPVNISNSFTEKLIKTKSGFRYSIIWLFADIILVIGSLVLLNYASWFYWSSAITCIVLVWAFRYDRALRQLSKPKFWIFFIVITMITAFAITNVQSDSNSLAKGLLIGIQMNFRAVIIIVGFSVLGTELYNPKIREFFLKTSFKQLPLALELSFESLPSMFANIPEFKKIIKNPVSVIYPIISQAESRLSEIKNKLNFNQKVFIITGSVGQGKTTFVKNLLDTFREKNITAGGIYSPRIMIKNKTIGYDIVDIVNNEQVPFLREANLENLKKIGRFDIMPQGLQKGYDALKLSANVDNKIVIIDEVGILELENEGWANSIQDLINAANNHILLVVRDIFTEKVIQKWNLDQSVIYNISENDYTVTGNLIIDQIK
jgi:nucleoside-triphosphatase THEP1